MYASIIVILFLSIGVMAYTSISRKGSVVDKVFLFCASIAIPSFVLIMSAILKHVIERRTRTETTMEMMEYGEVNIYIYFLYFQ